MPFIRLRFLPSIISNFLIISIMKKLQILLIPLLSLLVSMTALADTVNFKVNVSNPASLTCTVGGTPRQLVAGANDFSVEAYTAVSFKSVAPYYITNVTNASGTPQSVYQGEWTLYPGTYDEGSVYTIAVININNERDSEFVINIDDPSLVNARLSGWDQTVNLTEGKNTVRFSYLTEQYLYISSTTGKPLREVKVNGSNVAASNGTYTIELDEDYVVDITAVIPDKPVKVDFTYSETGFGAIGSVSVDGTKVEDFDGRTLSMKAGQTLTFNPDSGFKFDSVKIDGSQINWSGTYAYSVTVMDDMSVEVDAHPYGKIPFKVIVDDPSNIIFYRGYEYQNDVVALQAGENNLEVPENNTTVSWKVADGCFITSVSVNGSVLSYGSSTQVSQDMTIEFVTGKIVMDKNAVVWIDNREAANVYFSLEGSDRSRLDIGTGYNVISFYDGMNPFGISWFGQNPAPTVNKVYLDGELVSPMYEGSTSYQITIPDNGVVKIFLVEEPVECNVAFIAAEGVEASVKYDTVKDLSDWRSGFQCFKGTRVAVSGEGLKVAVGGVDVPKSEDGDYVFAVSDPSTTVTVAKDENVGVDAIVVAESDSDVVYTLMGTRAGIRGEMNRMAPGIYIINGKKVVKK